MCSRAVSPARLTIIEQRFVRGPSLWSGQCCLVTLLDMGPLARALSTDFPGLDQRLLALLPELRDFAAPLARGAFLAEVLARIALALQAMPGEALIVHGRQTRLRIVVDGPSEQLAVQAFDQAAAIVLALCAGVGAPTGRSRPPVSAVLLINQQRTHVPHMALADRHAVAASQLQQIAAVADHVQ